ncbi:High-affinity Na(+)/H(+) antiporter NhaS3 [Caulifigura coniformis]|uniref:High-affinity Na(+)/H(+) antiporter NhaS3 n=1 Tax=Caulifigura coniformis TaxID=2527983 RepID=A0A517SL40_9PLAN|nr:High-affinity Na(+)/H(+) antiporter NhaS3 [Caulifigura coniformis]
MTGLTANRRFPLGRIGLTAIVLLAMLSGTASCQEVVSTAEAPAAAAAHPDFDHGGGHADPVTPLLLGLVLILFSAKVGGALMVRLKQPAVLGELLVGVLMGNAILAGYDGFEFLRAPSVEAHGASATAVATTLDMLARIGVILLLFEVGLESNLGDMRRVGASAFLVAILGVVAPMILGWFVGKWFLPDESWHVHLFLGATLCATSVGITARVLKDLGKTDLKESQIVLGAAVIDDVMGLIVLAVVQAIIVKGTASLEEVAVITGKAVGFLVGAVVLGEYLFPHVYKLMARLRVHGMMTVTGLLVCFLLAWVAALVGLAPIVGAFAAGLILDERHYRALQLHDHDSMEEKVIPITTMLVPIFFVMMGFTVDLRSFANTTVLGLAAALTIAAIIGKQVCAFGPIERGLDRLSIGIGMIPRGEVGLIFAAIGAELKIDGQPVVSPAINTAIVVMVMVTTLITPPLLGWSMSRTRTVTTAA